ncbi:MAG: hypothetical protein L3J97_01815 [Thermoplasmata archaeon]|nr:hypothetical protein [Thermoplasmata archaeon]
MSSATLFLALGLLIMAFGIVVFLFSDQYRGEGLIVGGTLLLLFSAYFAYAARKKPPT